MSDKHTKLLDMLHGWGNHLDECGEHEEAERVANLYQKAGNLYNLASEAEIDEFITKFLNDDVLPVILGK